MEERSRVWLQSVLTKKQYLYYMEYYDNGLLLSDISLKYDVDITTVCRVLKNAKRRINAAYGEELTINAN